MLRAALALLILLAACERDDGVRATRAQCDAFVAAIDAWNADLAREAVGSVEQSWSRKSVFVGSDFAQICPARMTAKQVDCLVDHARHHSLDHASCKPEVDLRPADARHTPAECERYVAKVRELAATSSQQPRDPAHKEREWAAESAASECAGWLTSARYACVLAATTNDARHACPR